MMLGVGESSSEGRVGLSAVAVAVVVVVVGFMVAVNGAIVLVTQVPPLEGGFGIASSSWRVSVPTGISSRSTAVSVARWTSRTRGTGLTGELSKELTDKAA
jgi:hypothetical protein